MSSALPDFVDESREDRGPELEDVESPRRRFDNVLRKSDEEELLLACEIVVGVAGGVIAPLSCKPRGSDVPMLDDRYLVGDSGGVDTVLVFVGFEYPLPPGIVRWYPAPAVVLVWSCSCGWLVVVRGHVLKKSLPSFGKGNENRGSSAILFEQFKGLYPLTMRISDR